MTPTQAVALGVAIVALLAASASAVAALRSYRATRARIAVAPLRGPREQVIVEIEVAVLSVDTDAVHVKIGPVGDPNPADLWLDEGGGARLRYTRYHFDG